DQVRMHDVGERAELALEPEQVAPRRRAQELECDLALQLAIERAVDDTCAAGTQRAAHLESTGPEDGRRVRDIHCHHGTTPRTLASPRTICRAAVVCGNSLTRPWLGARAMR